MKPVRCEGEFRPTFCRSMRSLTIGVATCLLACVPLAAQPTTAPSQPDLVGKPAPAFEVNPIAPPGDKPLTLESFKGQTLLLEFWLAWGGLDAEANQHLDMLQKRFAEQGLRVLGISTEPRDKVVHHARQYPVSYQIAVGKKKLSSELYGVRGMPIVFLIDREGRIVWKGYAFDLTEAALGNYLKTGIPPALPTATSRPTTTANADEPPILKVELSKTRHPEYRQGRGMGSGSRGNRMWEFQAQTAEGVIRELLGVSRVRVEADPSLTATRYDYRFEYRSPRDQTIEADPRWAMEVFCNSCGLELTEVTEEREVWTIRRGDLQLKESSGPRSGSVDRTLKRAIDDYIDWEDYLRKLEEQFGVFLEDQTELKGRYDLWYPYDVDFKEASEQISKAFGLLIEKGRRPVRIYRLGDYLKTGVALAPPPPTSQPTTRPAVDEPPILRVELLETRHPEFSQPHGRMSIGRRGRMWEYLAAPAERTVRELLGVSESRIEADPPVPLTLYDYSFTYSSPKDRDITAEPRWAAETFCNACGLELTEITKERDVWTVRGGDQQLEEHDASPFPRWHWNETRTQNLVDNCSIEEFLQRLEDEFGVLLEDQTGLKGGYNLWYSFDIDFEEARAELSKAFGFIFEKERRPARIYRLRAKAAAEKQAGRE